MRDHNRQRTSKACEEDPSFPEDMLDLTSSKSPNMPSLAKAAGAQEEKDADQNQERARGQRCGFRRKRRAPKRRAPRKMRREPRACRELRARSARKAGAEKKRSPRPSPRTARPTSGRSWPFGPKNEQGRARRVKSNRNRNTSFPVSCLRNPTLKDFPPASCTCAKLLNQFFKENECEWPLERVADFKRTRRRILNRYYARRSRKEKGKGTQGRDAVGEGGLLQGEVHFPVPWSDLHASALAPLVHVWDSTWGST